MEVIARPPTGAVPRQSGGRDAHRARTRGSHTVGQLPKRHAYVGGLGKESWQGHGFSRADESAKTTGL
jgi:hypothetical protein